MRRYRIVLDQVMVPYHQRPLAEGVAARVLEAALGGPRGVVQTWLDGRLAAGEGADRWHCAARAALDAIEAAFAHFFVGMSRAQIDEARAGESLTLVLLDENGEDLPDPLAQEEGGRIAA